MSQRTAMLTEILGFRGWKVKEAFFEDEQGHRFEPVQGYGVLPGTRLVLVAERQWAPRCSRCGAICGVAAHEKLEARRWADLPWAGRPVELQAELIRVKCARCEATPVEMNAWAEPKQRQTHRLQQQLGLEAASMPVMHVAALHGLDWKTVRRAEGAALERWNATRPPRVLRWVGVDEKWLGRRHHLAHKFVTIVSHLETGEPIWIGYGRDEATLQRWIDTLTAEQKAALTVVAADMHRPFLNAIRANPDLAHVAVVHDPFHLMKRAGKAVDETRREFFFRAGATMRNVGRGRRWLLLRAWERCSEDQQAKLKTLFAYNPRLARVYQVVEEFREVLHAPTAESMAVGLNRILRRTQERQNKALRDWHDSLVEHRTEILALGKHRPPTGRIEALNTNWEALVRRARGYRDHAYLLLKLRFMTVNPIRSEEAVTRFLALGLQPPLHRAA